MTVKKPRSFRSNVQDAKTGRSETSRTARIARTASRRSYIVSTRKRSTPPRASAPACSRKLSRAASASRVPTGGRNSPVGPISPPRSGPGAPKPSMARRAAAAAASFAGAASIELPRSLIRLASHRNTSPADTLRKVNKVLAKDMRRGMFVTALYAVLAIETKELKVCSAGHNPMVYYNHQKGDCELINPNGIALGFDKGPIFDANLKEQSIQLAPNDRIVAYTDGVVEAMSEEKEEFGDKRFYAIVKQHATLPSKDFINKITGALEEHRGEAEQSDDITITTLKVC